MGLLAVFTSCGDGGRRSLTYKSFRDQYRAHIAHRRLFRLRSKLSEASTRLVLVSPEIAKLLLGPWPDTPMGFRCARLRAEFEGFLQGDPLVVCWTPFKGRAHHQLGRLSPVEHGVWDLRSVDPRPGLRVFFCLGARDIMVALTCSPRSIEVDWLSRAPLGPRDGPEWKRAIRDCRSTWSELFPGQSPLVGAKVDECFSNAKAI